MPIKKQQGFALVWIVILIVVLISLGINGFLFSKNQSLTSTNKDLENEKASLQTQLDSLREEKAKVDTELAVLKNTDLAKEIQTLQTKLNIAERDLAQKEQDLAAANNRLKTIEANRGKIKSHLDAIETVSSNYWKYTLTEPILDNIEAKIKALGDSETMSLWMVARNQTTPNSANPSAVWDVVSRILTNVRSLLP